MTAPRNPDTLITAFLAEGQEELPERAFDAVRRDINRTRQRVVIGPWREPQLSTITRLAIAAAVIVAVGVAWINFAPTGNIGGPPTPVPTASPVVTARPIVSNSSLEPGRYVFLWSLAADAEGEPGPSIQVTVPSAGWTSFDAFAADKNYGPGSAGAGPSFVVWKITSTYTDPCTHDTVASPEPGPGIDELLEALADQPGITAGALTPVTIDGYTGKYVDLTVATDIATCAGGSFFPWLDKFVQGNNELLRVYALDVDGFRLTFFLRIPERTTPADRTELEAMVDSVTIEP
jgi:hypothetical protein